MVTDPDVYPWGNELLLRDSKPVGFVSSAAFGHTLGRPVLMGYVERTDGEPIDRQWLQGGRYQVAVGGELCEATLSLKAPYDPDGARIRS